LVKFLVTDSTANLGIETIQKYQIKVVPLNVHLPDLVFKEGEVPNSEYYRRLKEEKFSPQTSQPSPADFLDVFNLLQPEDEAIVILISSHLSGTVQSALIARDMFSYPEHITVIDSYSSAMGLGFQVIKAAHMIKEGKSLTDITNEIVSVRDSMKLFFVVDTMEYLVRGGRVSHISGFLGNMLKIKPILYLKDGQIRLYDKVRTRQKALEELMNLLQQDIENIHKVAVVHVDAEEAAGLLAQRIKEVFPDPIVGELGPVIGSHTGPGTLGLIYY
jgi:DegV family protein with EDD domain